jgi:hypothetical protein
MYDKRIQWYRYHHRVPIIGSCWGTLIDHRVEIKHFRPSKMTMG